MSSTYSTNLAIELMNTGDQAGNWGATTNVNLGTLVEQAIAGYSTVTFSGADVTLSMTAGASATARNMFLQLNGTGGYSLIVPGTSPNANTKLYYIFNNTSGVITVKVSGQTGVAVPAAAKVVLFCNGTDVITATNYMASPTFSGVPVAPTASPGTNTTQIATTAFVTAALAAAYPVGAIYTSTVSTSPASLLGFGTWARFGQGRVLLSADDSTYTAGSTGGSADAIVVSHTHSFSATTGNNNSSLSHQHNLLGSADHYVADGGGPRGGAASYPFSLGGTDYGTYTTASGSLDHTHNLSGTTGSQGSSGTGANLQPYIVVYMWNRTA
jgi:hypothetical protein